MTECKLQKNECSNLVLRTAKTGRFAGQHFLGCKSYPDCSLIVPLHFDEVIMTDKQKKLADAFELFVRSNYFIYATFGVVYFNLRQAAFLDYLLRSDIVFKNGSVEVGLTGAKIYNLLFYHLFLIPTPEIKLYLANNFPKTFSNLRNDFVTRIFNEGIDYEKHIIDEAVFIKYSDIETYNI